MSVNRSWKIIQIVAAQPGWQAVYGQRSERREVNIFNRVIICWALVEITDADDARRTEVRGVVQESNQLIVVGDSIAAEENGGEDGIRNRYFLGYNDPEAHKESDYWITQANLRLKTDNGKSAERRD